MRDLAERRALADVGMGPYESWSLTKLKKKPMPIPQTNGFVWGPRRMI